MLNGYQNLQQQKKNKKSDSFGTALNVFTTE
jgi:hypothetical protein